MTAVASHNIEFLSHSDQGGRGDGVQVMVNRGFAYIGHGFSNGVTVIDVRDARNPKTVNFLACPPNTRAHHLQTATHEGFGDLLLAVNGPSVWTMQVSQEAYFTGTSGDALAGQKFTSGLRVYDLAKPEAPREIAFLPLGGFGPHRIWYVGGRYAYVSVHLPEFSDHILVIVDMAEPTRPEVVGKFWLPGMWTAGGETPSWPKGRRYALHHALVAGNLAYSAWRDGGMAVIDVGDPVNPILFRIAIGIRRSAAAPIRRCRCRTAISLSSPTRPISPTASSACATSGFSTSARRQIRSASPRMPVPDEADYCKKGGNFGPHNLWENRPGAFSQLAIYFCYPAQCRRARLRHRKSVRSARIGYFVPPDPARMFDPRPNRPQVIQSCDCFVDAQGVMYVTDSNAGLYILQFEGG